MLSTSLPRCPNSLMSLCQPAGSQSPQGPGPVGPLHTSGAQTGSGVSKQDTQQLLTPWAASVPRSPWLGPRGSVPAPVCSLPAQGACPGCGTLSWGAPSLSPVQKPLNVLGHHCLESTRGQPRGWHFTHRIQRLTQFSRCAAPSQHKLYWVHQRSRSHRKLQTGVGFSSLFWEGSGALAQVWNCTIIKTWA